MSPAGNDFYGPGAGYNVFAGRDASIGLATMELDPAKWAPAGPRLVASLSLSEVDTLNSWVSRRRCCGDSGRWCGGVMSWCVCVWVWCRCDHAFPLLLFHRSKSFGPSTSSWATSMTEADQGVSRILTR